MGAISELNVYVAHCRPTKCVLISDDEDDNQGDLEDDDDPTTDDIYPPALPPKRGPLTSRSWMPGGGQMPTTTSHDERIIPIVIEGRKGRGGGSGGGPYRQESTSSAVSAQTPVSDNSANPPRIPGGHQYHRFSDSMTSSTSSSGFGTDIHSLRHSLPSPVMEASNSSQQQIMSEGNEPMIQPSISKQASRKSKTKETSPLNSKSKRSSSKKKKSSSSSVLSGSVLDQAIIFFLS